MISLEHVNKYFGEHHVLKDITLNVEQGEKNCHYRTLRLWKKYINSVYEPIGKSQ